MDAREDRGVEKSRAQMLRFYDAQVPFDLTLPQE
jgi:hypothetical protein